MNNINREAVTRTQQLALIALRHIGGMPDFSDAKCVGSPEEFDLDVLDHDKDLVEDSKQICRSCVKLSTCRTWTNNLNNYPSTRVKGVVQAGEAWGLIHKKKKLDEEEDQNETHTQ